MEEARVFERVLVVDGGRIVEDGAPSSLETDASSRYAELVRAQATLGAVMSSAAAWRRLRLKDGSIEPVTERTNV